MFYNPFDSVAKRIKKDLRQLMKREFQKYKSIEREKGRDLSWKQSWAEWTEIHKESLEKFLIKSLSNSSRTSKYQKPQATIVLMRAKLTLSFKAPKTPTKLNLP
jgi:hypothetical protein